MNKPSSLLLALATALPLACAKKMPDAVDNVSIKLHIESGQVQALLDEYEWDPLRDRPTNTRFTLHSEATLKIEDDREVCALHFERKWGENLTLSGGIHKEEGKLIYCMVYVQAQDWESYNSEWRALYDNRADGTELWFMENSEAVRGFEYQKPFETFGCNGASTHPTRDTCSYSYRYRGEWHKTESMPIQRKILETEIVTICQKAQEAAGLSDCK